MQWGITHNRRHLQMDGKPFLWLGDTAWLLFEKLTYEEALVYLDNRAEKGFTVIQATLVHKAGYANSAGSPALIDNHFATPNKSADPDAYWPQVHRIVRAAGERGLVMALLPCWGCFVSDGQLSGDTIDPYIDFLVDTFADCANVLWLVGGDVRGSDAPESFTRIGERLRQRDPKRLIGFHPFGRCSSSLWFANAAWLDFHMFQSGHRRYDQIKLNQWDDKVDVETFVGEDSYRYVQQDYARSPAMPVLDGEPSYELIPQGLHDATQPYWQACDVRRYAYWSLLAGACGFTYGSNAIMQFWKGKEKGAYGVLETWEQALHNPGSMQMTHLRALMETIHWYEGRPAQEFLFENEGKRYDYNLALLTPCALCVYTYTGKPFTVHTDLLPRRARAWWFDPLVGGKSYLGEIDPVGLRRFTPPDRRLGQNDFILLLTY